MGLQKTGAILESLGESRGHSLDERLWAQRPPGSPFPAPLQIIAFQKLNCAYRCVVSKNKGCHTVQRNYRREFVRMTIAKRFLITVKPDIGGLAVL
ncbi:MAG: hypothetical protein M2R46_05459 [Verrucomicrobia subdivision 3 bacterium]|nr:hypothetical protein [Limisphaerales bacterium]